MKKLKRILALSLAVLMLSGCGTGESKPTEGNMAATKPSAPVSNTQPTTQLPQTYPTTPMEPTLPQPEANPYDAEDFVFENGFLTCTATETLVGIDVSVHQGVIDWQQVAAAGVEFVMIRAAYRGYKYGQVNPDPNALANIQGARDAGLLVGVYIYSQAINVKEAVEEAEFLLQMLEGTELDLPITFDWERYSDEARTANVSGRTVTECAVAFCEAIRAGDREAMVYFNAAQAFEQISLSALMEYPFWLALYDTEAVFPYRVHMWQYSNTGKVPGIAGNVDLNIGFFTRESA